MSYFPTIFYLLLRQFFTTFSFFAPDIVKHSKIINKHNGENCFSSESVDRLKRHPTEMRHCKHAIERSFVQMKFKASLLIHFGRRENEILHEIRRENKNQVWSIHANILVYILSIFFCVRVKLDRVVICWNGKISLTAIELKNLTEKTSNFNVSLHVWYAKGVYKKNETENKRRDINNGAALSSQIAPYCFRLNRSLCSIKHFKIRGICHLSLTDFLFKSE